MRRDTKPLEQLTPDLKILHFLSSLPLALLLAVGLGMAEASFSMTQALTADLSY